MCTLVILTLVSEFGSVLGSSGDHPSVHLCSPSRFQGVASSGRCRHPNSAVTGETVNESARRFSEYPCVTTIALNASSVTLILPVLKISSALIFP